MKNDINNIEDIKLLVDTFYSQVQKDTIIGGIFIGAIKDWPTHLTKMYSFWQTLLLGEHTYNGSPFPPHADMPIEAIHFEHWLRIWKETVDTYFNGAIAEEAKWRGEKMATIFLSKIEFSRNQNKGLLT